MPLLFSCSQRLLDYLAFKYFDFEHLTMVILDTRTKGPKQGKQNLGARKPKSLSRIEKIWEQENQRA
jgi:hypothetical protein